MVRKCITVDQLAYNLWTVVIDGRTFRRIKGHWYDADNDTNLPHSPLVESLQHAVEAFKRADLSDRINH